MTPQPVPITDSIIITNASDEFTRDAFQYYFENAGKSRGGEVFDVKFDHQDGYCVVTFKDPKGLLLQRFDFVLICILNPFTLAGVF